MLVETKARVGVFAIALGAYLPQFPTLVPGHRGGHRRRHRHHQRAVHGGG